MKHATRLRSLLRDVGTIVVHLAHGGLLSAGVIGLSLFAFGDKDVPPAETVIAETAEAHPAPTLPSVPVPSVPIATAAVPTAEAKPVGDAKSAVPAKPVVAAKAIDGRLPERAVILTAEMQRVRDYVARRYRVSTRALEPVFTAAQESGRKMGVDPLLIVAMIAIESRFNPFAESVAGAQGLMQVIPRFHMDKVPDGRGADAFLDPQVNVRIGTLVLVEGLNRYGTLQGALQYYGGAPTDPAAGYANKVLEMKQRFVTVATGQPAIDV